MTARWSDRLAELWAWLNGDLAYRHYVAHSRQAHPERTPLDRQTYYLHRLDRRYQGVNRCC